MVLAQGEPALEQRFGGLRPFLFEPDDGAGSPRGVAALGEVGQGRATPAAEGRVEKLDATGVIACVDGAPCGREGGLEAVRVELARVDRQGVGARSGEQPTLAEALAQPRDVAGQSAAGGLSAPDVLTQALARDKLVGRDQEPQRQRPAPPAGDLDDRTVAATDLERPEDAEGESPASSGTPR